MATDLEDLGGDGWKNPGEQVPSRRLAPRATSAGNSRSRLTAQPLLRLQGSGGPLLPGSHGHAGGGLPRGHHGYRHRHDHQMALHCGMPGPGALLPQEFLHRPLLRHPAWPGSVRHQTAVGAHLTEAPLPFQALWRPGTPSPNTASSLPTRLCMTVVSGDGQDLGLQTAPAIAMPPPSMLDWGPGRGCLCTSLPAEGALGHLLKEGQGADRHQLGFYWFSL
ncbi:PREDICTED: uncharacterized protein LOC106556321 [Thamnophis sirtalis]|uniref:Uncharacterized protein LOC106556321 n=1 Tax=Thamnophis sirtalis TaxID=35019 RepID=A0A6I9Z3I9_9SAUR|nr:PREDICTED: uncharacterized protein LOC106556321 [Thamnophis sirtalis]